jgi:hypothetical protein
MQCLKCYSDIPALVNVNVHMVVTEAYGLACKSLILLQLPRSFARCSYLVIQLHVHKLNMPYLLFSKQFTRRSI